MVVVNVMIVCTVYCVFGYMFIHLFFCLFLQPLGVLLGVAPDLILVQASPLISPPGEGAYVAKLRVSQSVWLGVGEKLRGSSIGCVGHRGSGMFQFQCVCKVRVMG